MPRQPKETKYDSLSSDTHHLKMRINALETEVHQLQAVVADLLDMGPARVRAHLALTARASSRDDR